jgi:thiamine biosynthesis lipoprotein
MPGPETAARTPTRREFVAVGVGALVVASIPWTRTRRVAAHRTLPVMGTLADITVVHRDPAYAQAAIGAALARLQMVDRLMTRFQVGSDVGRANDGAAREAVRVTRETAAVLAAALAWAERTDGAFDPALGRAIRLWDVGARTEPPAETAVVRLAGRRLYRVLDVDRWQGLPALRFGSDDVAVDLGGIAKGYGVDQAVAALREWGIAHALVNVGGDLAAIGRADDDRPWRVGVRSPDQAGALLASFDLEDAAIATSGDYLQYFEYHGRRYHHLLDPETAAPRVTQMRSITVQAADCMTADAAATACFGREPAAVHGWLDPAGARIVHSI